MTPVPRAAERLLGMTLAGGWKVVNRIVKQLDATGGFFSVGYIVEAADGKRGFLKALDYSQAFQPTTGVPVSIALQELTESINFEKYVLARCRDRGLDKIVIAISDGTITVGQPGLDTVEYLIFELADGDVRKQMSLIDKLDVLWRFKSLHDIATGLEQLHWNDIVHQDLKPSNVLVFNNDSTKLADFGRSACDGQKPPHASCIFAGDLSYAPPDVLYRFTLPSEKLRQLSFDAYLLGSMVVFFFAGQGTTPLILNEMPPLYADWQHYGGTSDDAKLHLRDAFSRFLLKLEKDFAPAFKSELVRIVKELCEPDPTRRGHPKERRDTAAQFSLKRYVTRFDLLLKRAELGLSAGVV
jgi:eukaryotic-like serine/threonine-protein kinase